MCTHTPDRVDAATAADWTHRPDAMTVIDVRSPASLDTADIAASYNVPLDLLSEHAVRLDRKVVLVCPSGVRAPQAQHRFAAVLRRMNVAPRHAKILCRGT